MLRQLSRTRRADWGWAYDKLGDVAGDGKTRRHLWDSSPRGGTPSAQQADPTPWPLGPSVLAPPPRPRQTRAQASRARAAIWQAANCGGGRASHDSALASGGFSARSDDNSFRGEPTKPRRNRRRAAMRAGGQRARRLRGLTARAQGARATRAGGQLRMSPPRRMSRRWGAAASSRGRRSPDAIDDERRRARTAKRPRGPRGSRKRPTGAERCALRNSWRPGADRHLWDSNPRGETPSA